MSLNTRIFVGALVGVLIGLWLYQLGIDHTITQRSIYVSNLISGVFVDLLKMLLVPLVFTSIAVGVARLREHHQIHRVWMSALIYFSATTLLAIIIGLTAMHLFNPGAGMHLDMFKEAMINFEAKQMSTGDFFAAFLHGLFMNPIAAMAQGNIMAVVMFGLLLGISLVVAGKRYQHVLNLVQEFFDLLMIIVGWVMQLAPFGVMALLIKLVATQNAEVLSSLIQFVAMMLGTTLFHGIVVLPFILYLVVRMSPLTFWKGARAALITAFATSSSSATLPITLRCLEKDLKVNPDIAGFVAPLGAQMNMDGTALYEAAAALFIANLAGIELTLVQQLVVCLMAMLASVGAPGIPSAGLVTMVMVLQSVGLPAEAIAILLPIDRLLDTVRTTVNVQGDMIGSLVVQKLTKIN
jgi:Na+/H+-dicarboxylate symporter